MKKTAKKTLAIMVIMILSMSLFSVSAFAQVVPIGNGSTFYEIASPASNMNTLYGGYFTIPSGYNRLTVSAKANNLSGTTTATIKLQKCSGTWPIVASATIPTNGSESVIFSGLSVSGTYRFVYTANGNAAQVIIGGAYGNW